MCHHHDYHPHPAAGCQGVSDPLTISAFDLHASCPLYGPHSAAKTIGLGVALSFLLSAIWFQVETSFHSYKPEIFHIGHLGCLLLKRTTSRSGPHGPSGGRPAIPHLLYTPTDSTATCLFDRRCNDSSSTPRTPTSVVPVNPRESSDQELVR